MTTKEKVILGGAGGVAAVVVIVWLVTGGNPGDTDFPVNESGEGDSQTPPIENFILDPNTSEATFTVGDKPYTLTQYIQEFGDNKQKMGPLFSELARRGYGLEIHPDNTHTLSQLAGRAREE